MSIGAAGRPRVGVRGPTRVAHVIEESIFWTSGERGRRGVVSRSWRGVVFVGGRCLVVRSIFRLLAWPLPEWMSCCAIYKSMIVRRPLKTLSGN